MRFGGTGKADASFAGIGRPLDKAEFAAHATRVPELNWGLMNFDNFRARAHLGLPGLHARGLGRDHVHRAGRRVGERGRVFFSLLVMLGSFFAINLTLAVLETNFSSAREQAAEARLGGPDLSAAQLAEIRRCSTRLDADGSGAIEEAELGDAMRAMGRRCRRSPRSTR